MGDTPGYTIALVQMKMGADADENLRRALQKVEQAAALGAQVICLPELYKSQYFCQKEDATLFDLAEPLGGPSVTAFQALAARLGVAVIVPFF